MKLTLLTRQDCGLCEDTASLLRDLGLDFESVDIDTRPELLARYDAAVPVVLAGEREICRAPVTEEGLRSALRTVNLGSGR